MDGNNICSLLSQIERGHAARTYNLGANGALSSPLRRLVGRIRRPGEAGPARAMRRWRMAPARPHP
jgi:hypothetical protein